MQHNRFFGLQGYAADSVYIDLGEVDGEPLGYWQVDGWATRLAEVALFTAEIDSLDLPDVESVIAGASCLDSDSGVLLSPSGATASRDWCNWTRKRVR